MKKLIFTLTGLALSTLMFAQQGTIPTPKAEKGFVEQNWKTRQANATEMNKASLTEWYQPLDFVKPTGAGANLNPGLTFVSNDSNFKVIREDNTIDYVSFMSFGMALDPEDDAIELSTMPGIRLSKYNPYRLDSIRFKYLYVRNVDVLNGNIVTDTLFVSFFRNNKITKHTKTVGVGDKFLNMPWDAVNKKPSNPDTVITYLLDGANTVDFPATSVTTNETLFGFTLTTIAAPENFTVNADAHVAYTVTFKSGIPAVEGADTAIIIYQRDSSTFPVGARRANTFGMYYSSDQASTTGIEWANPTYYNTSVFQTAGVGYGQTAIVTEVRGKHIPGVYFTSDLFADGIPASGSLPMGGFLITCDNASLKEMNNDVFAMTNVYPNPAKSSDMPALAFNLKRNATVNVSIMNMIGQEVKNLFTKTYSSGTHSENVDINGLKPGVYFVNMTVNGSTMSKKLTITE